MEKSKWAQHTIEEVEKLEQQLDQKQIRKLRFPLLKKLISRIGHYSSNGCSSCEALKQEIHKLLELLEKVSSTNTIQLPQYKSILRQITKHLQKEHKLIEEGTYMIQFLVLGMLIGTAFISYFAGAIAIGLSIGLLIGAIMDSNAKKNGKVI